MEALVLPVLAQATARMPRMRAWVTPATIP